MASVTPVLALSAGLLRIEVIDISTAKDRKNSEGYSDPTAYAAMRNIHREEDRFNKLRRAILSIIELAGFELRGPLTLVDKKTGKVWR